MAEAVKIVEYFRRAGITLSVSEGRVVVSEDSVRTSLTDKESSVIERNSTEIIEYLGIQSNTSKMGSDKRLIGIGDAVSSGAQTSTKLRSQSEIDKRSRGLFNNVETFNGETGDITGVNSVNGLTGDVKIELSSDNVSTFNGKTGDVVGVDSVNGKTGAVTLTDLVGVSTFNGVSGAIEGVSTFNSATGAIEGVSTFNSATGAAEGVSTFNGSTGAVEGVASFNGSTGAAEGVLKFNSATGSVEGVSTFNSATGAIDTSTLRLTTNGMSANAGISTSGRIDAVTIKAVGITTSGGISCGGNIVIPDDAFIGCGTAQDRIKFNSNGNEIVINTNDVQMNRYLSHLGDEDTRIEYTANRIGFEAGGVTFAYGYSGDFVADKGMTISGELSLGATAHMGGNIVMPEDGTISVSGDSEVIKLNFGGGILDVSANQLDIPKRLRHRGDSNTYLEFTTDRIGLQAGGTTFAYGYSGDFVANHGMTVSDGMSISGGITFTGGNIAVAEDSWIGNVSANAIHFNDVSSSRLDLRCNEVKFENLLGHYGDGDTYLKFDTNQFTVHAGGADQLVCTASKVAMGDIELERPKIKDFGETVHAVGNVNSSTAFDFENGNVQTVTVSGIDIGSTITWSLSNPPASGVAGTMTVIFTNGLAHGDIAFHSSIKWPSDVAPTLSASGIDIISFLTTDGGSTYYGFVGGLNFS